MSLSKLKRHNHRFNHRTENVAIQLTHINLNDPTNPNFKTDTATGLLLHNACGILAEFDNNGNPKTEIQFRIREPKSIKPGKFFPSIAKLTQQHDKWLPVPTGGIIILERAYLDKPTQSLSGGWLTVGARDQSTGLEACHISNTEGIPYLMCVEQQRYFERSDNQKDYFQFRILLDQTKALKFQGMDQFKSCAIEMLDQSQFPKTDLNAKEMKNFTNNLEGRGVPGVVVRCADIGLENNRLSVQAFARRLELGWDAVHDRRKTPIESVEKFIDTMSNSDWIDEIEKSTTEEIHFELIPYQRFNTGYHSLPVNQTGGNVRDDSIPFDSPLISELGDLVINDKGKISMGAGYAPSILVLTRSGVSEEFQWNAKSSYRTNPTGPISPLSEVITPTLPDELKEVFEDRANERSEIMYERLNNAKEEIFTVKQDENVESSIELKNKSENTPDNSGLTP